MAEVNINVEGSSVSGYDIDVTVIDLFCGEEWHQWEIVDGQLEQTTMSHTAHQFRWPSDP